MTGPERINKCVEWYAKELASPDFSTETTGESELRALISKYLYHLLAEYERISSDLLYQLKTGKEMPL